MLAAALGRATGRDFAPAPVADVSGGSVHRCVRWPTSDGPVFVKIAPAAQLDVLEAEAAGLRELAAPRAVRLPRVLATAATDDEAALALEWIEFRPPQKDSGPLLGRQLARLHRTTAARFGWHRDNTIGRTPQVNTWADDWARFFAGRRLGYQLDLAEGSGRDGRVIERGRRLVESCGAILAGHRPQASLLHGDLWGGNWAVASSGEPVIYDPATYFGDREADLAMTQLFGGFGPDFQAAYAADWPLKPGADLRCTLYNLYHVLNHWNLFGGSYGARAAAMIDRLLAEC